MTPIDENAVLGSDLDCQGFYLRNVKALDPVPPPLLSLDDARFSDKRPVPAGSVTDASVATVAAISQSKLNFNGSPPTAWLGNTSKQFAQADLVQRVAQKNSPNGYAGLDSGGLLAAGSVTTGGGGGRVNSVGLAMPKELLVSNSPIVTSGVFGVAWANASDGSWFGAAGSPTLGLESRPLLPSFLTSQLPLSLIPGIDASKFGSGIFDLDQLPLVVGTGATHAKGLLPDPGEKGDPNDYLGRDGKWKPFSVRFAYQPTLPDVTITLNSSGSDSGGNSVTLRTLVGAVLFYRINGGDPPNHLFIEVHVGDNADSKITLTLSSGDFVEAYAARPGYNNSNIATYIVKSPTDT